MPHCSSERLSQLGPETAYTCMCCCRVGATVNQQAQSFGHRHAVEITELPSQDTDRGCIASRQGTLGDSQWPWHCKQQAGYWT